MASRKIIRGDTDTFTVRFYHTSTTKMGIKTQVPVDITGWEIKFTVRQEIPSTNIHTDSSAVISKIATIEDGTTGYALFEVPSDETDIDEGAYWYDIQYTKPDGTIKSLPKGRYIVSSDITRDNY